jgi:hypothetical protein
MESKLKSIKINKELHKLIKIYCIENDINMYKFIEKIIQEKIIELKNVDR